MRKCFVRMCRIPVVCMTFLAFIFTVKAQFILQPEPVLQAEGLEAVFECRYPDPVSYAWFFNQSFVSSGTLPQGVTLGEGTRSISILALPQYNNSAVQCRATDEDDGGSLVFSEEVTLTVFRIKPSVVTRDTQNITIDWSGPTFTNNIDYTVNVTRFNAVSNESEQVASVAGLTGTQYTFSYPNHTVCDRFSFTVTPTEGEMEGTSSQPVPGFFTQVESEGGRTDVSADQNETMKQVTFNATVPNCTNFTTYQVVSDLLPDPINGVLTESPSETNVSLTFLLPTDKRTNITVTLSGIDRVDLVFQSIPTKTTDIQDLAVIVCPQGGCIRVSIVFVGGSHSPGALVCVMPILTDNSLDYNNMLVTTIPQSRSEGVDISVPSGRYRLFAFDLESNGLPRMPISVAADNEIMDVPDGGEVTPSPPPTDVEITASKLPSGCIEVTCSDFLNSNLNCLVLVQSTNSPDQVAVDLISSDDDDRTVCVLSPGAGNVSVVVYTWKGEFIFNGTLSHVSTLELPTSPSTATLDTTTSSDSVPSSVPPGSTPSIPPGVIVGVVIVLILIVIVTVPLVYILSKRNARRRRKVFNTSHDSYNRIKSSESESAPPNSSPQEMDMGVPLGLYDVARQEHMSSDTDKTVKVPFDGDQPLPGYDVIRPEHMETVKYAEVPATESSPFPQYETVALAKAGASSHTTTPTESEPPPLPPPKISEDSDAPPLPPPYNPAVESSLEESKSDLIGQEREDSDAPPLPPPYDSAVENSTEELSQSEERVGEDRVESVNDGAREGWAAKRVQYTLVQPKSAPGSENQEVVDPSKVVYAEVDKKKLKPKPQEPPKVDTAPRPPSPPLNEDSLRLELYLLAGRWEDLARALNVDEDVTDNIFTINENNQLRLHDLVDHYFQCVHYEHSWREIVQVLRNIGEYNIADKISKEKLQETVLSSQYSSVV